MTNYLITRVYSDSTCMQEHAPNIVAALETAAIYLRDESCWSLKIEELHTLCYPYEEPFTISKEVMNYYRP